MIMAISYEQAKKKAISLNSSVNAVEDYGDAYCFFNKNAEFAYGSPDVIIMKSDGTARDFVSYMRESDEVTPEPMDF